MRTDSITRCISPTNAAEDGDRRIHRHRPWRRSQRSSLLPCSESLLSSPRRTVRILAHKPSETLVWDSKNAPQLVVVTAETPQNVRGLRAIHATDGGTVLYVATAPGRAETLASLAGVTPWNIEEAAVGRGDVMLGEIAFDHPLFALFGRGSVQRFHQDPLLEISTHRWGSAGGARVLARFENRRRRHHRETHGQRKARRSGERMAASRQPARPVVEVRPAHVGITGVAKPAAGDRGQPACRRPGAASRRGRRRQRA